jgi:hypothetical protein
MYGYLCVCLLLQDLVQSCLHGGGGDMGGHVLRETRPVWTSLPILAISRFSFLDFFSFENSPNERDARRRRSEVDGGEEPDRRRGVARAC